MSQYNREGPANQFDDAARNAYSAAMDDAQEQNNKGVRIYERPHLWDEEKPCSFADTPTDNFIPTPTINTGDGLKNLSPMKKAAVIAGLVVVGVLILVCAVSFVVDNYQNLGLHFYD